MAKLQKVAEEEGETLQKPKATQAQKEEDGKCVHDTIHYYYFVWQINEEQTNASRWMIKDNITQWWYCEYIFVSLTEWYTTQW